MAYREASGWLAHAHVWIHPQDLALRDAGLAGSYAAAARAGRLPSELRATLAQGSELDAVPSDLVVGLAVRFARLWRRLAELRTWSPLADTAALEATLQSLGFGGAGQDEDVDCWLASVRSHQEGPILIQAGGVARDWTNRTQAADPLGLDAVFLAACLWRHKGFGRPISLPFWSAGEQRHHRLSLKIGLQWTEGFLDCVAAAAHVAVGELDRLQRAEEMGRKLGGTTRSRLPDALQVVLQAPIVTAQTLAKRLDVTSQAATGLLRQLLVAGIVREATGRASWRAFVLS